jgi:DNA polymerase I-like protein with 3'-5' exonuclease and polymerase domains
MPVDQTLSQTLFGIEHLDAFASSDVIVFDTETTGLRPEVGGLRLIQVAAEGCPVVVVDYWELDEAGVSVLRSFFEARPRKWYAHNATFDLGWLQEHSIYPNGHVYCTMLASRLLENGVPNARHGLAAAAKRYLDVDVSKEEQRSDWSAPVLSESQMTYAANDVRILLELVVVICQRIKVARLDSAWALECKALAPIAHMQRIGLPFNRQKLVELQQSYEEQITELGAKFVEELDQAMPKSEKLPRDADGSFNLRAKPSGSIREGTKLMAGFNLNSSAQLVKKFTALLGQPPIDEKTQKPSASTGALRAYAADHSVIQLYLAWKKAEKRRQMVSALLEHQADDGFIRANYMQLGADTGRMSCREPNLQQVPRDKGFRAAAEAPEGWTFVCADFGQMELRLAAAVSEDERMIQAFQQGEDLHTITAAAIYPEPTEDSGELKARRQVAKSANFGLLFGSGAKGLRNYAGSMGITMTIEEAEQIRDTFHATYRGIHKWQQINADFANKTAREKWAEVRIPQSDMRRFLLGDMNRLTTRCNTPIQGAGAAILKLGLGRLWPYLKEAGEDVVRLCAVVHDEVLLLVREGTEEKWAKRLSKELEQAESLWLGPIPPLAEAAWGKTWADAK